MKRRNLHSCLHLKLIAVFVVSLLIICFCGCGQSKQRTLGGRKTPGIGQISKEQLRENLDTFEDFFRASVKETGDKVDAIDSTTKTRKINLVLKTRTFQAMNAMLEQEDPVVAFIETWGLIVRFHRYLEEGIGSSLFAGNQHFYIEMAAQLEARIESIGKTFMTEDVFGETRKHIYSFARSNPLKTLFSNSIVYATKVELGKPSPFEDAIGIPLAPITAMKGVDKTATSISRFTDTAGRFSNVVEELPESVRWQLLALLYDLEEIEITKSFLASISKFSDSSEQLAENTKNLPQDIREQISILVEEIDNKQANLQATLDKIQEILVSADKTATSFQATAVDVSQAATAWDKAANSTQKVLNELSKLKPTRNETQAEPFKIKDVQEIAEKLNQTVIEISNLVESQRLADYASTPKELVNLLAWRLGQLTVLIFVLALVHRIVGRRLVKKEK